jgi:hypothetical protein
MARTSFLYLVLMALAGLMLGALDHLARPQLFSLLPPLFCLLLISLVFDFAVQLFGAGLRLPALAMPARVAGFLSGAVLYFLITWIFGTPDLSA